MTSNEPYGYGTKADVERARRKFLQAIDRQGQPPAEHTLTGRCPVCGAVDGKPPKPVKDEDPKG